MSNIIERITTIGFEVLLDHLVISITNDICLFLLEYKQNLIMRICKKQYLSKRALGSIKNNLAWTNFISAHIKEPINIYDNRYDILVIHNNELHNSYIKYLRTKEFLNLTSLQYIVALFHF